MTAVRARRSVRPSDAFPDGAWRNWRSHVLTVDIEAVHAAVIAERLERFLEVCRQDGISLREVAMRTGISKGSLSTMARCLSYSMEGIVARLQACYAIDMNPADEVRAVKVAALERRCAELQERNDHVEERLRRLEHYDPSGLDPPAAEAPRSARRNSVHGRSTTGAARGGGPRTAQPAQADLLAGA